MYEVKKTLYWILAGTMGGTNRVRILEEIFKEPQNTNKLSKILNLDFKTVQYHLKILEKNGLVTYQGGGGFAKLYFPSKMLEENVESLNEILKKIEEQKSRKKKR